MNPLSKAQFVAALDAAGVDDTQKQRFHQALERTTPDGHQAFLDWLGIPAAEAATIRAQSRA